ncbi:hypothetical protein ACF0H5_000700 [Mactra antiquata]
MEEQSKMQKITKTIFLVLVWVCIGLTLEITGPTLKDLIIRIDSNYESMSTAVFGRSAGFFIGSALGGVLVDKLGFYCDLMVAICLDLMGASIAALPWVPSTELIFVMSLLGGTFEGVINIAGQKLIINMWLEKSASPLHLLHGGFGVGSFIIPLIANPFLAKPAPNVNSTITTNESLMCDTCNFSVTTLGPTTTTEKQFLPETSRIEYAYAIAGSIAVLVSFIFYTYHFLNIRERQNHPSQSTNEATHKPSNDVDISSKQTLSFKEMFNPSTCANGKFCYGVSIFVLVFLFFMQAVGGERVGGKFIRAFAIDYHDFSPDDGSYLNTVFWIAFTCGRFAGFIAARWIPIRILILIETGGCLAAAISLTFVGTTGPLALWINMPILAVFIAPLFPSGIGWAEFHIDVTGIAITVFLLGGSIGGIVYMRLIGFLYDNYGPEMFIYTLLGYAIAVFGLTIIMTFIGGLGGKKKEMEKGNETQMNGQPESATTSFTDISTVNTPVEQIPGKYNEGQL